MQAMNALHVYERLVGIARSATALVSRGKAKANLGVIAGAVTASLACGAARAADGDIHLQLLASPASVTPVSPGHAFLCVRLHLAAGVKEDCFGFYPTTANLFGGPAKVVAELSRDKAPERFTTVTTSTDYKIDDAKRRAIYKVVQKWAGEKYNLVAANCGDMVSEAVKAAGLKAPESSVTVPVTFVQSVAELNK